jgi:hypothetical protein
MICKIQKKRKIEGQVGSVGEAAVPGAVGKPGALGKLSACMYLRSLVE